MKSVLLASFAVLTFCAAEGAQACPYPQGNFLNTCKPETVVVNYQQCTVSANCKNLKGEWVTLEALPYEDCIYGVVNCDGHLKCSASSLKYECPTTPSEDKQSTPSTNKGQS